MEIRRVVPEDIDGFYDLFSEVIAEGIFLARKSPPPKEAVYRALVEAQGNDWAVFVACHENETIGSAEAYPESFCKAGGRSDVALLGMQVKHSFRARGVGSRPLGEVIEKCQALRYSEIRLSVLKSNLAAISLYKKHGFVFSECDSVAGEDRQWEMFLGSPTQHPLKNL